MLNFFWFDKCLDFSDSAFKIVKRYKPSPPIATTSTALITIFAGTSGMLKPPPGLRYVLSVAQLTLFTHPSPRLRINTRQLSEHRLRGGWVKCRLFFWDSWRNSIKHTPEIRRSCREHIVNLPSRARRLEDAGQKWQLWARRDAPPPTWWYPFNFYALLHYRQLVVETTSSVKCLMDVSWVICCSITWRLNLARVRVLEKCGRGCNFMQLFSTAEYL